MMPHLIAAFCLTWSGAPDPPPAQGDSFASSGANVQRSESLEFLDRLVARYRELATYRDLTNVVRIIRSADDPLRQRRSETQMICDVREGELRITTPGSQLRDSLRQVIGLNVPMQEEAFEAAERGRSDGVPERSPDVSQDADSPDASAQDGDTADVMLRYHLWLAPHLGLKFSDDPLQQFRPTQDDEGFTATEPSAVTVDDRVMMHVELKSGRLSAGADAPDDFDAKFDLYVNPSSMLIERIEGHERLPDGGSIETTYTINPIHATVTDATNDAASESAAEQVVAPAAPVASEANDTGERETPPSGGEAIPTDVPDAGAANGQPLVAADPKAPCCVDSATR